MAGYVYIIIAVVMLLTIVGAGMLASAPSLGTPRGIYRLTKMNMLGCTCLYIFLHLVFILDYLGMDIYLLFHIGRKNK